MDTQVPEIESLPPNNPGQLVTFQVGNEEYGFDILAVREIVRQAKVTRIPLAPKHVKGVTNLRGEVLPVIDLRNKFGLPEQALSDKSRILVVDRGENQTGLIVDAVHQVTRIELDQLNDAPESINSNQGRYVKNVARLDDGKRIVMNLDPEKICEFCIDQSLFDRASKQDNSSTSIQRRLPEETVLVVIFATDGIEYCLPISSIQEVIRLREPRRPKNAPPFLRGILSLRNKVLPIVDMRTLFKRRSIEAQRSSEIAHKRLQFETWADEIEKAIATENVTKELIQSGKRIVAENHDLRSADKELNQSYDSIRLGLQASLRITSELLLENLETKQQEFSEARSVVNQAYDECNSKIGAGARKDQRIIVAKAGPIEIGLQVDAVREIRSIPKSAIEEPPSLSKTQTKNLIGVAKIDEGKRMILMIDPEKIIPEEEYQHLVKSIKDESKPDTESKEMKTETKQEVSEQEIQLVCFRIGEDEFGAPINTIREIDRVSRITAIPEAPSYIEGISNLRGEVLPIVNLRKRFKMEEQPTNDKSRIVVADIDGQRTGLLVDSVSHVLRIPQSIISGPPRATEGSPITEFVTGIAKANDGQRIIVVIDLERLINATDTTSIEA